MNMKLQGMPSCFSTRGRSAPESTTKRVVLFGDPDTFRGDAVSGWLHVRSVIRRLEDHGVTVVLWGNETRSQMEVIQRELSLHHPFISETGAGLFLPHGYFGDERVGWRYLPHYRVVDFGKPYHEVAEAVRAAARKAGVGLVAFSDMSIQDVADKCGLSLSQARLAKLREYDEPFRLVNPEPAVYSRLCNALRRLGLRSFTHETFHYATGTPSTAQSLRLLTSLYQESSSGPVLTVGLARARSETGLLDSVDIPIVVQGNPIDAARLAQRIPTALFTTADSPQNWSETVLRSIDAHLTRSTTRMHMSRVAALARPAGG